MDYIQVSILLAVGELRETLLAELSEIGFDGFEETDTQLNAFIGGEHLDKYELQSLLTPRNVSYTTTHIPAQNWNALWEENFEPVVIPDFCTVNADFHTLDIVTPYQIIITPKMSFGTGHHATTQLMLTQMRDMNLKGKKVFDFGTGTGILAILAEMLGAAQVIAIDNDEWSYTNAKENVERNACKRIKVREGSIETLEDSSFDIVLANINRHILLQYAAQIYGIVNGTGVLLMSGLLKEDKEMVVGAYCEAGFKFIQGSELDNWIVLRFEK
jgi:ribosomal protein L11 methyltransferase